MSKVAFKVSDILTGGQYHDRFYDEFIQSPNPVEKRGQWRILDGIDENAFTWAWLVANAANIQWEGVGIWVEAAPSYKTTNVPAWLPNNTYVDENGDTQTHTFESWVGGAGAYRERTDNSKWLVKMTTYGDLDASQVAQLNTFITGDAANLEGLTHAATLILTNGPEYN